jgi:hypothetical protein
MSDFLSSLKSDLLDRRFLPVLALLGVALLAAVAYAVLGGGGGSSTSPAPAPSAASPGVTKTSAVVAITKASTDSDQAVAETTSGASQQHSNSGNPRDPFKPLPGAKTAGSTSSTSSSASKGSSSSGASSSSGSGQSTSSAGGTTPTPATTPLKPVSPPKRYYIHFHVTAQFGVVAASTAGAPPQPAQLQTFPNMALNEPLPSKENPQVVYLGVVVKTGNTAAFGLTGEAILHGSATCKPSPTQCEAIELQAGRSETLEVVSSTGQTVTYELKLVSITKSESDSASAAKAHAASRAQAKVDRNDALKQSGLHYSPDQGGLVFIGRPAFGAHVARHR